MSRSDHLSLCVYAKKFGLLPLLSSSRKRASKFGSKLLPIWDQRQVGAGPKISFNAVADINVYILYLQILHKNSKHWPWKNCFRIQNIAVTFERRIFVATVYRFFAKWIRLFFSDRFDPPWFSFFWRRRDLNLRILTLLATVWTCVWVQRGSSQNF